MKEKKVNKYCYCAVIQGYFGYGWEDVSYYDTKESGYRELLKHDLREYRFSGQGIYKVIHRREVNKEYQEA